VSGAGDPDGGRRGAANAAGAPLLAAPLRIEVALIGSAARGLAVTRTGMGPRRAIAAQRTLERADGAALVVLGFCGGLDEESVPGEVIIPEEVYVAADEAHVSVSARCELAPALVTHLAGRRLKLRSGPIVCVSRLATGERRAELLAGGAIGVDMESVWLAAGARGRPFGVVRVVLDSPSHELLHPRAVGASLRAARALRRVAGALHDWVPGV
jgi:4-hydroxy-3-methylbut-2-enyl diphosphate reductase